MTAAEWVDLRAHIEAYLRNPPRRLVFEPRLERKFQWRRAQTHLKSLYFGSVFGLVLFNLTGVAIYGTRLVSSTLARDTYLASQLLIVVPMLVMLVIIQRFPPIKLHLDKLLMAIGVFATLGLIPVNRLLQGDIALYQAFSLVLLPIAFNLVANISYSTMIVMACGYVPALAVNSFTHPGFPPTAAFFMTSMYALASIITAVSAYRMEQAERKNYLSYALETLRNAEISKVNRRLAELSHTDALTGLPNRRDFDERYAAAVRQACETGRALAVIVLDIDHFKLYNDRLGHPAGDACLRVVATAIAEAIGPAPNFAGRIGGEEFAVVLPDLGAEAAAAWAARIRLAVQRLRLPHPALGERGMVSVSLGAASLNPACPETPETLLARADAALYRAKRTGRDRAEVDLRVVGA